VREARRVIALDGLRGVAAVVVLLCHVLEAGVAAIGSALVLGGDPGGVAGWLLRTPLAVVWAGQQFVIVFFVLSGFVLTRALRGDRRVGAAAFYAGRLVRLYLPAWLSLVPALVLLALIPRVVHHGGGVSWWLDTYARPVGADAVARDLALVLPDRIDHGTPLNRVLWSLRWEVLFSLALPVLLRAQGLLRRGDVAVAVAAGALAAVHVGRAHAAAVFLAPFALGMVMALHEDAIASWRARLAGRGAAPAVVLAACLLTADRWLADAGPGAAVLVTAGAALMVLCPLLYASVERPLQTRPLQWLGSRSFSLYLVHFPIVLACAFGLGRPGVALLAATAIPASLLAAELFHRAVERPCHRLARAAGAQRWRVLGRAEAMART
jgi:peptidoglycan/LPS O-acetylase OafA/YrhL